jgi:hypothetical protein
VVAVAGVHAGTPPATAAVEQDEMVKVTLRVNGRVHSVLVETR